MLVLVAQMQHTRRDGHIEPHAWPRRHLFAHGFGHLHETNFLAFRLHEHRTRWIERTQFSP